MNRMAEITKLTNEAKRELLVKRWRTAARELTRMAREGRGAPDRASMVVNRAIAQQLRECAKQLKEIVHG